MPINWPNTRGGEKSGAAGTSTPSPGNSKNMRTGSASGSTASPAQSADNKTYSETDGVAKSPRDTTMSEAGKGKSSGGGKM